MVTEDESSADSETTLGSSSSPPVEVLEDSEEQGSSASIVVLVVVVGLVLCLAILVTVVKVSKRQDFEMMNSFTGSIASERTVPMGDDPYLSLRTLPGPTSSVLQSATRQDWLRSTSGSSGPKKMSSNLLSGSDFGETSIDLLSKIDLKCFLGGV